MYFHESLKLAYGVRIGLSTFDNLACAFAIVRETHVMSFHVHMPNAISSTYDSTPVSISSQPADSQVPVIRLSTQCSVILRL